MLLRDEGVQILDPLFSASKWMLLWETVLRTVLGEDVVAEYRVADDAGVRFLCDTRLRTLLVGGCYCAIKGSRFWTPYFLHLMDIAVRYPASCGTCESTI